MRIFKKSKKRKAKRRFLVTSKKIFKWLIVAVFIGLTAFFFNSPLFKIKKIDCYSLDFPCSPEERLYFEPLADKNIFFVPMNQLTKEVKQKNLKIKEIEAKRVLPNKITVKIIPRIALANLTSNQKDFYISDEQAFVFEKRDQPITSLPVVLFDKNFTFSTGISFKGKVSDILELVKQMKKKVVNPDLIEFSGSDTVSLIFDKQTTVTLSLNQDFVKQLDSLQLIILRSKIEGKLPKKIDLRFEKPTVVF